jgi:hypothetical protein
LRIDTQDGFLAESLPVGLPYLLNPQAVAGVVCWIEQYQEDGILTGYRPTGAAKLARTGQGCQAIRETRCDHFIEKSAKFLIGDFRAVRFRPAEEQVRSRKRLSYTTIPPTYGFRYLGVFLPERSQPTPREPPKDFDQAELGSYEGRKAEYDDFF